MNNDAKEYMVNAIRKEFIAFMQSIARIPGAHVQKQQAFLRFDEGHMWMQNAILSYVEPQPEPPVGSQPAVMDLNVSAQAPLNLSPEEIAALAQQAVDQLNASQLQPEGQAEVSEVA